MTTSGRLQKMFPTPRAVYGEHPGMKDPRHLTGAVQSTSFAEVGHASLSVWPGSDEARRMTVTSGRSIAEWWLNSGPVGALERMFLGSSQWVSTAAYLTWKLSGTPAGHLLFRLVPSMPRTAEIASGLWPTPNVPNGGRSTDHVKDWRSHRTAYHNGKKVQVGLESAVKMWPTPRSTDGDHGGRVTPRKSREGGNLVETVSMDMFPTPTQRDWRSGKASQATMERNSRPPSEHIGGSLNPTWVEWLMGYPIGWTALDPSETPSSRKSSRRSAGQSSKRKD
jgi:hypothetical protein